MRLSTNLNIMTKAIDKASSYVLRDFNEIENLQNNAASATKFANSCYNKIKERIIDDLSKFRLGCNLIFPDGNNYIASKDAEYSYIINPIDGLYNFSRSIPYFAISIALEHKNLNGATEVIAAVVNNIVANEVCFAEKGFGAYLNNRRIRVSKRNNHDSPLLLTDDLLNLQDSSLALKKFNNLEIRNYGSAGIKISHLASAKADFCLFSYKNYQFLQPLFLLVKEAGGLVVEKKDQHVILTNNQINFS
jgi:myo-inositol-1(or 4)-monophosphatase